MTDEETIRRLVRNVDSINEWKTEVSIARAAEAERWKVAVESIDVIKTELINQGKDHREQYEDSVKRERKLVIGALLFIGGPVGVGFINWVMNGGLAGAQ